MRYKIRAVADILETNLPTCGPGDSARKICMFEPSLLSGRTARMKTITPIPPIQCDNERQNKILFGIAATFVKIEEPVVVNREDISKNASKKFGTHPLIINGTAPNKAINSHDNDTMINDSRGSIFDDC